MAALPNPTWMAFRRICLVTLFSISLQAIFAGHAYAEIPSLIGDRIVVAINSIPYSQLQIERYISVKESLRDSAIKAQVVDGSNWQLAVDAFVRDMMIHQDATKSSGFRPTKEAIVKLRTIVERNIQGAPQLKGAFERLDLGRTQLETEILKIATVENYRRGKKSLDTNGATDTSSWEDELVSRSIVRYFDDAKTWKVIAPKP